MTTSRRSACGAAGAFLWSAALVLVAGGCSERPDTVDVPHPAVTTSTSTSTAPPDRSQDHVREVAAYASAVESALPTFDGAVFATSGAPTGNDTPDGWRAQSSRNSFSSETPPVGDRRVLVVCAGRGDVRVSVTVRAFDGEATGGTPVETTCGEQASSATAAFVVAPGDQGFEVDVEPGPDAVAVVGYVVT